MKKITLLAAILFAAYSNAQECEPGEIQLDFESVTVPSLPSCTAAINNGSGNSWITSNNPGNGFISNTLQYTANGNDADAWFFTPGIEIEANVHYRVSYRYGNNGNTTSENLIVTLGNAPAIAAASTFASHNGITGGTPALQNITFFSTPTAGTYYFGFHATSAANQGNLYVDDIIVERSVCGTPSNVSVTNITNNSATLNWEAPTGGNIGMVSVYQYAYGTTNTPPADGTYNPATTIELTSLEPATSYFAFTRTLCGPVWSDWVVTPFTTEAIAGTSKFSTDNLKAYPNPVKDILKISAEAKIENVEVYNITGQLVLSQKIYSESGEINVANLAGGAYVLHVFSQHGKNFIKMIKE